MVILRLPGTNDLDLGTGAITLGANRQVTVNAGTLTGGGTVSAGLLNFIKTGGGTLSFGSNDVTLNSLSVNAGTLRATAGTNEYCW